MSGEKLFLPLLSSGQNNPLLIPGMLKEIAISLFGLLECPYVLLAGKLV